MSAVLQTQSPAVEFDRWFESLVERSNPDVVVAIARGAARLLQLRGYLEGSLPVPFVSHHALPFLPDANIRGKRVLLFDDSIIYGSTMSDVSDYVSARRGVPIHAAYIADQDSYFGNPKKGVRRSPHVRLAPDICRRVSEDSIRKHHATLVHELYDSGLDSNLDFPKVSMKLKSAFADDEIPYFVRRLAETTEFANCFNVTYPVKGNSKVQRWTALHDWTPCPTSSEQVVNCANAKTRLTFIPEAGEIRLTESVNDFETTTV